MELKSVGTVIGRREFAIKGGGKMTAVLGKPQPFTAGQGIDGFYFCPFQTQGIGQDVVMYSSGPDEISAILSAIRMLGARVKSTPPAVEGKLIWLCDEMDTTLGFPEELYLGFKNE